MSEHETNVASSGELDLYQEGASIAFGVPYDQVTREQRGLIKERCWLFAYRRGMSKNALRALIKMDAEGLREQLARDPEIHTMRPDYTPLWYWIREREAIRLCKERGEPFPWTTDPIFRDYRFCCVRREDDRVTQWIRTHVRERFCGHPYLWLMLCICRQINWPETLAELIAEPGAWPHDEGFHTDVLALVLNKRKGQGDKVYTGAYMIPAPHERGADKHAHIARVVIGDLWRRREEFADWTAATLEGTHAKIIKSSGWGYFLAYQAVVDMRFTSLLSGAPDVTTWAAAGPGTIRGLNRLHGRPLDEELKQPWARQEMRQIYDLVVSETGVPMDFSDVPNVLCETDKYLRVQLDQGKPRARYVPGRGS